MMNEESIRTDADSCLILSYSSQSQCSGSAPSPGHLGPLSEGGPVVDDRKQVLRNIRSAYSKCVMKRFAYRASIVPLSRAVRE